MKINGAEYTFVNIINTLMQLARTIRDTNTESTLFSGQQITAATLYVKLHLKRRPTALVLLMVNPPSIPSHFASHPSPVTCHTASYGQLEYVIFTQSCSEVHLSLLLSLPPLHKLQHLVCGQGAQATPKIKSKE